MKLSLTIAMFSLALLAGNAAAGTVTVNFTTLPGNTAGGYYVGNAGATVNGVPTSLMCDDFTTETHVPSGPFQYNVATLANLATAKFTGLANYEAAAVLRPAAGVIRVVITSPFGTSLIPAQARMATQPRCWQAHGVPWRLAVFHRPTVRS